jgi:predicted transposase/invertase (TIGR01784 family)
MTVIGISPTVDFAFKLMLGSPEHVRVTIHFLNAILSPWLRIKSVQIQNPFLSKENEDDKLSVLDVLAVDQEGRMLNIEMQTTLPAGMNKRLVYHGARLYGGQLTEGDRYTALHPAIIICVLTKPMYSEAGELHLEFRLRDSTGRILTDDLQIHLLQLSKLDVTAQNVAQASPIEQWAFFMLNADKMTVEEVKRLFPDPEFAEAAGVLVMISKTPEQQMQYDARRKFQMDEAARLELVELARNEGLSEGRSEGEAKGVQKGILLGRIALLEELLGEPVRSSSDLSQFNEIQLSQLAEQLQIQLRNRGQIQN